MRYCPKCGTHNEDSAKFCTNCGADMSGTQSGYGASMSFGMQQAGVTPPKPELPTKTPFYKTIWFTVLMLLIFPPLGITLIWVFHTKWHTTVKVILTAVAMFWMLILFAAVATDDNDGTSDTILTTTSSTIATTEATELTTETEATTESTTETTQTSTEATTEATTEAATEPQTPEQQVINAFKDAAHDSSDYTAVEAVELLDSDPTTYRVDCTFIGSVWDETDFMSIVMSDYINMYRKVYAEYGYGCALYVRTEMTDARGNTDTIYVVKMQMAPDIFALYNWSELENRHIYDIVSEDCEIFDIHAGILKNVETEDVLYMP